MSGGVKPLVESIQVLFPKFKVEESNILNPTTEFIVQFYNLVLNEFQCLIFSAVSNPLEDTNHHEKLLTPEKIFYELSKISDKVKWKLTDIYQPNFVRTKNFLKIFLHFYSFSVELLSDTSPRFADIVRTREHMCELLNKKDRLLEIISEVTLEKEKWIDEAKSISDELSSVEEAYTEIQKRKTKKEEIYGSIEKEIEELEQSIYLENLKLKKEEKEKGNLTEQTITEAEYNNLLDIRDSLQNELKSLDDVHATEDDSLSEQNKILKHHEDCRKALPDISELQSLEKVRRLSKSSEMSKDIQIKLNILLDVKGKADSRLKQEEQTYNDISNELKFLKSANKQENHELLEKREKFKQATLELGEEIRIKYHAFKTGSTECEEIWKKITDERQKLLAVVFVKFNKIYSLQKNNYSKAHAVLHQLKKH